jgi:PAS domain S-box-containing protein
MKKNAPKATQDAVPENEALVASELRYRRLFETAKDGILILDAETGIVVDVNPFLLDLLGYPYENFVGKAIWDLGFFKDIVANQKHFEELQRKEYIRYEDKPLETDDGRRIDVEFVSNVYLVNHKKVIQCNIRDITQRKRTEEALRASQRLTEGIINAIPVRVFWKDRNLVYLGCNAAFARDAGFTDPKDVIGKDDYQMGWRDQAELYRADDRRTIESGNTTSNREEPQTTPEGNTITLLTSKMPLRNSGGEITGVLGAYVDITEQRQMEAQLRQAQKMEAVGRLAGGVAHDFNNMLGVILGYTEMALAQAGSTQPLCASLQEIQKAAERSASLTQQLLAFARKQTIAPKILNLNDAVEGLLNMLRRLIGEDINLVWLPSANRCQVKLDPTQIDQILANLCLNARDAIANGGKITLETGSTVIDASYCAEHIEATPGEYVFLSVSDDGRGMDKKTLAHIFEPFFTTKEVGKGTGLGLAMVYGIVKQNNGFVYAYSEPGVGTTLRIYLPQVATETGEFPVAGKAETPKSRGETVLLVEDEPSLNEMFELFLQDLGYSVLSAKSPEEALKLFAGHSGDIQLLLTDVIMPGMNGKQLAKQISAIKPDVKVLFMSGYSANEVSERGRLEQKTAFIAKPFTRDELARKVRDILEPCKVVT